MVTETLFKRYELLKKRLQSKIFGQKEAINELVDALIHIQLSPSQQNFKGMLTFIGPHNSGKLYTAKILEEMCEEYEGIKILDMAQFTDPGDQKKLFGPNGMITQFNITNPKGILVFKDIEKCDNVIQIALLNLLNATEETTSIHLQETLIIFTSSLGSPLLKKEEFLKFYKKDKLKAQAKIVEFIAKEKKIIYDLVENAIDPELLSFIVQNYIILFQHLNFKAIIQIASKKIEETLLLFQKNTGIKITLLEKKLIPFLVLSFSPYINARRVDKKSRYLDRSSLSKYR